MLDFLMHREYSFHQLAESEIPWVILGHSERRSLFHETSADVGKKVASALKENLSVIACVGETLEQREAAKTLDIIKEQLDGIKSELQDWRWVAVGCLKTPAFCLTHRIFIQSCGHCLRASMGHRYIAHRRMMLTGFC